MAHAAKINTLSEGLVAHLTGRPRNSAAFKQSLEQASRHIKSAVHVRTNPFDVNSKLDGLIEKFTVRGRDDVAEALRARLDELPTSSKWLPEVLSLFLHLSDDPVQGTSLEDLEDLRQPLRTEQALTWQDIIADDPLDEPEIWDSVERGYHSSGDEAAADDDDEDITASTDATSVAGDDVVSLAQQYVLPISPGAHDSVKGTRDQLVAASPTTAITELAITRETLSMLHGLPTSIFEVDSRTNRVSLRKAFTISATAQPSVDSLLTTCADIGSALNSLRHWARAAQNVAYLQSCQSSTRELLTELAHGLAAIEKTYAQPEKDTVVSIIELRSNVEKLTRPLICLSGVVARALTLAESTPFAHLDLLYNEACIAHMSGDALTFKTLLRVLFAGLTTYLRSLSVWIRKGSLVDVDQTLFVIETNPHCELSKMWHDRFSVRTLPNGLPSTPEFMQHICNRAFTYGKSKAFLMALDGHARSEETLQRSLPDFNHLFEQLQLNEMCPFSETLTATLDQWVTATGQDCTPLLCRSLLHEHSALDTFRGLNKVFCSQDGQRFTTFADALFWRMDNSLPWRDRFLLTEFAQGMLGGVVGLPANSLRVVLDEVKETAQRVQSSIDKLQTFKLEVLLPFAVQSITLTDSAAVYSKAFTYLLQIYRAKYILRQQASDLRFLGTRQARLSPDLASALRFRQALSVQVDVITDHITKTAAVLNSTLCRALEAADGIDGMVAIWTDHQKQMETSLLLSPKLKPIREASTSLFQLCEQFGYLWRSTVGDLFSQASVANKRDESRASQKPETAALPNLNALQTEFGESLSFLANGLRSISRVGGNSALESLADRLQWNVQ